MSVPRVFIIGPGAGHNYSAAGRFGPRIDVGVGGCNPFNTDALIAELSLAFSSHSVTAEDFIVLGSSAVLNALACALLAARFGKLRLLIYGAQRKDYTPRDIEVPSAPHTAAELANGGHQYASRDDGLRHCLICNGAEASLTTQCPGRRLTDDEESRVLSGDLNFIAGEWVGEELAERRN